MPMFCAHLSLLFTELPFAARFAAARQAGFSRVEYMFPYDHAAAELRGLLLENGLTQALFNLPAGDWDAGDRGVACDPDRVAEFRAGVEKGVQYALALGVKSVNCLPGKLPAGCSEQAAWNTLDANLRHAADVFAGQGLTLLVEFVNRKNTPGALLHNSAQALALLGRVERRNLRLLHDLYHAQREEGDLVDNLTANMPHIGHIHLADTPGRHQPGTGEINYAFVLREMDRLGYQGLVGLEYQPKPDTAAGLKWLADLGYRP